VLNTRLKGRVFIAGDYSIADMACYPWIVPHKGHGQSLGDFPHLKRWIETMARRPAVIRAYVGTKESYSASAGNISEEERRILFGTSRAKVAS
jgi:GST-like protein